MSVLGSPVSQAAPSLQIWFLHQEGGRGRIAGTVRFGIIRKTKLIFCGPDGANYSPDRIGARASRTMRRAGLQSVRLHSLRDSRAMTLPSRGVPLAVVSERLG